MEQNLKSVGKFSYFILKETEKAVYIKVPYWKGTSESKKKHIQEFFETWIPKTILNRDDIYIKHFVVGKKEEIRIKNSYQRILMNVPDYYNTFGEFAPEKQKCVRVEIDWDKLSDMKKALMVKCNVKDYDKILIDGVSTCTEHKYSDAEEDEIHRYAVRLRNPKQDDTIIPKKNITYYK